MDAVYVGRPTRFGNPFAPTPLGLGMYRDWLTGSTFTDALTGVAYTDAAASQVLRSLVDLRGKDLVCWCPLDKACHADILLEIANR